MKKVIFVLFACLFVTQMQAQSDKLSDVPVVSVASVDMASPEVYFDLFVPETRTYRAVATYPGAVLFEWMTMSPGWKIEKTTGTSSDMHDVLIVPASNSAPTTMLGVRAFDGVNWSEWTGVGYVSMN